MARPREYDEQEVLEKAMEAFWTHGYEATSLADLMSATGLAKGSLYKGFGDKKELFLKALEHYLARGRDNLRAQIASSPTALDALRAWLMGSARVATCSGVRRGCMATNCKVELGPHDSDVRKQLRAHARKLEEQYELLIADGIAEGTLRPELDPAAGARWLTTIIDGLQVRGKLGMTRKDAEEAVGFALAALVKP